jgi:mRNA-degrading endonuclease RelE of RelBE toxin-antitoxin system
MRRSDRERRLQKADAFAADPFAAHPWATPMQAEGDRVRIRQGVWRGIALIVRNRQVVVLERVGHRGDVYR